MQYWQRKSTESSIRPCVFLTATCGQLGQLDNARTGDRVMRAGLTHRLNTDVAGHHRCFRRELVDFFFDCFANTSSARSTSATCASRACLRRSSTSSSSIFCSSVIVSKLIRLTVNPHIGLPLALGDRAIKERHWRREVSTICRGQSSLIFLDSYRRHFLAPRFRPRGALS